MLLITVSGVQFWSFVITNFPIPLQNGFSDFGSEICRSSVGKRLLQFSFLKSKNLIICCSTLDLFELQICIDSYVWLLYNSRSLCIYITIDVDMLKRFAKCNFKH